MLGVDCHVCTGVYRVGPRYIVGDIEAQLDNAASTGHFAMLYLINMNYHAFNLHNLRADMVAYFKVHFEPRL
jgi:hypothetical protein|tara:strand:+ start:736 stop:951 length:216 start_codon:yes stop_codon:yes gene_type:complete